MKKLTDLKIVGEDTVRQLILRDRITQLVVNPTTYVTPQAKAYMEEKGVILTILTCEKDFPKKSEEAESRGEAQQTPQKPEHMTSLEGTTLVSKNHPRIALRGKFDSLQGSIIQLQVEVARERKNRLLGDLGELLDYSRLLLLSEVTGKPVPEQQLLGLDMAQIRERSHHPEKYFGRGHTFPDYKMGALGAGLNCLRTQAREVELAAINAFCGEDSVERVDIIRGLNRLSSAIYILMIQYKEKQKGGV